MISRTRTNQLVVELAHFILRQFLQLVLEDICKIALWSNENISFAG